MRLIVPPTALRVPMRCGGAPVALMEPAALTTLLADGGGYASTLIEPVTTLVADAGGGSGVAPLRHVRIGEALYSRACLLNHSCEPNANVAFDGAALELRAAAPLAIGEAVLTCYGPQVGHEPLRARRAKLLNGYFFRCGCVGCARSGSWPTCGP